MAIIQISKIQQRSGKLIDLPQLSDAEFGWATDSKRLFIGKSYPNENIEVLTSYSNISFSQIDGSGGNNISLINSQDGQVMAFDATGTGHWVNRGGNAGGMLDLGTIANVKIDGGAIGYTIETDGTGNLSWTPKSTIIAYISSITRGANTIITTDEDNFFTEGLNITITDVIGTTQLNGNSYYVNVQTSNTFEIFSDPSMTLPIVSGAYGVFPKTTATATAVNGNITLADTTGFSLLSPVVFSGTVLGGIVAGATYYVKTIDAPGAGNVTVSETVGGAAVPWTATSGAWDMHAGGGRVISTIGGGGASRARGANTTVQFNDTNIINGTADFTFNKISKIMTVSNTVVATLFTGTLTTNAQPNINSTGLLTGLVVGNLTANTTFGNGIFTATGNANIGNIGTAGQIIALGNVTGSNMFASGTANVTGNVNAGNVNSKFFGPLNGTVGAATPNTGAFTTITSTLTIAATGNLSGANVNTAGLILATGNITGGNLNTGGVLLATGNANAANFNTTGLVLASGNVTGGNLNTTGLIAATGNVTGGNLVTGGVVAATGNVSGANITGTHYGAGNNLSNIQGANVSGQVNFAATANAVAGANVSGQVNFAATANAVAGGNVSGQVANALVAGTVYTAAQPNITSTGTLTRVLVGSGSAGSPSIAFAADGAIDTGFYWGGDGYTFFTNNGVYSGQMGPGGAFVTVGSVQTPALTTGAAGTAGSLTGNWTLTTGSKLQATYADLAEKYVSDTGYDYGTVLEFGGNQEVTMGTLNSTRVAGVVSRNPAYIMNAGCEGSSVVDIALQGRVAVFVVGEVRKGDMLVSAGNGYAYACSSPSMGQVIGKALADRSFDSDSNEIEVAVGRL